MWSHKSFHVLATRGAPVTFVYVFGQVGTPTAPLPLQHQHPTRLERNVGPDRH